jgi:thiosulfate/3-mercaptopyruvate sulfurtransferase
MRHDTYARLELLAEPDWLQSAKDDPEVCVVDCSGGHDRQPAYIPGAVPLPVHFSLKDSDDPLHVMSRERFAEIMEQLGIGDDTTVVAYDRHAGMAAARLWWVLSYYGHAHTKLLNGGWHRWRAENRPRSLHPGRREPQHFTPRQDNTVLARKEYVRERLGDPDTQILDVRNRSEYGGHNPWGNRRVGHIPGALHWEWVNNLTDDRYRTLKPPGELWASLGKLGLAPEKEVITHCQAGIRASHAAFVLNVMGFPRVRNYEASMKEWANADDTPMEDEAPDSA